MKVLTLFSLMFFSGFLFANESETILLEGEKIQLVRKSIFKGRGSAYSIRSAFGEVQIAQTFSFSSFRGTTGTGTSNFGSQSARTTIRKFDIDDSKFVISKDDLGRENIEYIGAPIALDHFSVNRFFESEDQTPPMSDFITLGTSTVPTFNACGFVLSESGWANIALDSRLSAYEVNRLRFAFDLDDLVTPNKTRIPSQICRVYEEVKAPRVITLSDDQLVAYPFLGSDVTDSRSGADRVRLDEAKDFHLFSLKKNSAGNIEVFILGPQTNLQELAFTIEAVDFKIHRIYAYHETRIGPSQVAAPKELIILNKKAEFIKVLLFDDNQLWMIKNSLIARENTYSAIPYTDREELNDREKCDWAYDHSVKCSNWTPLN